MSGKYREEDTQDSDSLIRMVSDSDDYDYSSEDEAPEYLESQKQKRQKHLQAYMKMLVELRAQKKIKRGEESCTDYGTELNNEDKETLDNDVDDILKDIIKHWNEICNQNPETVRTSQTTRKLFGRTPEKGGRTRKLRRVKRRKTRKLRKTKKVRQPTKARKSRRIRK